MIKTATSQVTQEPVTSGAAVNTDEAQVVTRQTTSVKENAAKQSAYVKDSVVQANQYSGDVSGTPSYQDTVKELEERRKQLLLWEERLNEMMKDPNNADRIVNFLTGLQFLRNKVAELSSQLGVMAVTTNGYSFQDRQSVLQSSSVRRKDPEALRKIERSVTGDRRE